MMEQFYDAVTRKFGTFQGVPIFEDFDSEQDKIRLQAYVARLQSNKGIRLPRHRFLVIAVKA